MSFVASTARKSRTRPRRLPDISGSPVSMALISSATTPDMFTCWKSTRGPPRAELCRSDRATILPRRWPPVLCQAGSSAPPFLTTPLSFSRANGWAIPKACSSGKDFTTYRGTIPRSYAPVCRMQQCRFAPNPLRHDLMTRLSCHCPSLPPRAPDMLGSALHYAFHYPRRLAGALIRDPAGVIEKLHDRLVQHREY